MRSSLMQKDLPKTISALKDHPLYVIQRHLLKFQAIYPAEIVPVGFINKEPIFPRDSVYEVLALSFLREVIYKLSFDWL